MEKKNMVLLTVIAVATLLVAVVGATFAYFTATVSNSGTTETTVKTQQLASLAANTDAMEQSDAVYPGWMGYQKVTVNGGGGEGTGKYSLNLTITGDKDLTDMVTYTVYKGTGEVAPTWNAGTADASNGQYSIKNASFEAPAGFDAVVTDEALATGKVGNTVEFTGSTKDVFYIVYNFKDTGAAQDNAQGKTFTTKVSVNLEA